MYTEWNVNKFREEHNLYGGIGYYRIVKPFENMPGARVCGRPDEKEFGTLAVDVWTKVFEEYDCVFIKHIDNAPAISNLLAASQYFGKPVIIDVDDNFIALREDNPAFIEYQKHLKPYILSASLELASGVAVSTQPLKEAYSHISKNISVLPNCNDTSDWQVPIKKWNDGKVRIGYAGSITHNADLELILEPVKKILATYPNTIFEILGAAEKKKFKELQKRLMSAGVGKSRFRLHYGTPAWLGYPELLGSMGWDIGLAPLITDTFNTCKSHIKWMEYSMINIPTVASQVYPYYQPIQGVNTIVDGHTGYLCSTSEQWFDKLAALVESKDLRDKLANNAYTYIAQNWQYSQHQHKWLEAITKAVNKN